MTTSSTQENPDNQLNPQGEDLSYLEGLKRFVNPENENMPMLVIGGGKNHFIPPLDETRKNDGTSLPPISLLD